MKTISIDTSIKDTCLPMSINRVITMSRSQIQYQSIFWPQALSIIQEPKLTNISVEEKNVEYLKDIKKHIRGTYNMSTSYSEIVNALIFLLKSSREVRFISINTKGYKAAYRDYTHRLTSIGKAIIVQAPDYIFIQEFRLGVNQCFLNCLLKALNNMYSAVLPMSYKEENENMCLCITLIRKGLDTTTRRMKNEESFKLRYNILEIDQRVFVNAWIPQVFSQSDERLQISLNMWNEILDIANYYTRKNQEFYVVGDLNSYATSPLEDQLHNLERLMINTKTNDDYSRPTGITHILDHCFANRFSVQNSLIQTSILEPSLKESGASDHDALLTTIKTHATCVLQNQLLKNTCNVGINHSKQGGD